MTTKLLPSVQEHVNIIWFFSAGLLPNVIKTVQLLLKAGFPLDLLLNEVSYEDFDDQFLNVLDFAIRGDFSEVANALLDTEEQRRIFFDSEKGEKYKNWWNENRKTTK